MNVFSNYKYGLQILCVCQRSQEVLYSEGSYKGLQSSPLGKTKLVDMIVEGVFELNQMHMIQLLPVVFQ